MAIAHTPGSQEANESPKGTPCSMHHISLAVQSTQSHTYAHAHYFFYSLIYCCYSEEKYFFFSLPLFVWCAPVILSVHVAGCRMTLTWKMYIVHTWYTQTHSQAHSMHAYIHSLCSHSTIWRSEVVLRPHSIDCVVKHTMRGCCFVVFLATIRIVHKFQFKWIKRGKYCLPFPMSLCIIVIIWYAYVLWPSCRAECWPDNQYILFSDDII